MCNHQNRRSTQGPPKDERTGWKRIKLSFYPLHHSGQKKTLYKSWVYLKNEAKSNNDTPRLYSWRSLNRYEIGLCFATFVTKNSLIGFSKRIGSQYRRHPSFSFITYHKTVFPWALSWNFFLPPWSGSGQGKQSCSSQHLSIAPENVEEKKNYDGLSQFRKKSAISEYLLHQWFWKSWTGLVSSFIFQSCSNLLKLSLHQRKKEIAEKKFYRLKTAQPENFERRGPVI